jgi:hypothetical protein
MKSDGWQALGSAFGGVVQPASNPVAAMASPVKNNVFMVSPVLLLLFKCQLCDFRDAVHLFASTATFHFLFNP